MPESKWRRNKDGSLKLSGILTFTTVEVNQIETIAGTLRKSTKGTIEMLAKIGLQYWPQALADTQFNLTEMQREQINMNLDVAIVESDISGSPVPIRKIQAEKMYKLTAIPPHIREFLLLYMEMCEDFPRLKEAMRSYYTEEGGLSGTSVHLLNRVLRNPYWNTREILAAIRAMSWYNLSDDKVNWEGATISWLCKKTRGEQMYGFQRLLAQFRAKFSDESTQKRVQQKFGKQELAELRLALAMVAEEGMIISGSDDHENLKKKFSRALTRHGVEKLVKEIKGAENKTAKLEELAT
jgi:hypothetical protein